MKLAKLLTIVSLAVLPLAAADAPPRKAPEFASQTPAGGQILLSQYKGKVVCLAFVYTTCPHCQALGRMLTQLSKEYGPRGFQPLASAFNPDSGPLVPEFVKSNGITFPVGFGPREPVLNFLQIGPDVRLSVPQIVLIDRKGMIRQQSLPEMDEKIGTEANLRATIEMLLKEPAGPAPKRTTKITSVKKPS